MISDRKYLHDRLVLLLLSVNAFLALLVVITVLLRIGGGTANGFIVQYRSNLGISAYKTGGITLLYGFVGAALLMLGSQIVLSARVYYVRRQLAVAVLALGTMLLLTTVLVSNALLALH